MPIFVDSWIFSLLWTLIIPIYDEIGRKSKDATFDDLWLLFAFPVMCLFCIPYKISPLQLFPTKLFCLLRLKLQPNAKSKVLPQILNSSFWLPSNFNWKIITQYCGILRKCNWLRFLEFQGGIYWFTVFAIFCSILNLLQFWIKFQYF